MLYNPLHKQTQHNYLSWLLNPLLMHLLYIYIYHYHHGLGCRGMKHHFTPFHKRCLQRMQRTRSSNIFSANKHMWHMTTSSGCLAWFAAIGTTERRYPLQRKSNSTMSKLPVRQQKNNTKVIVWLGL